MTAATHTPGDDPAVKHYTTVRVMRTRINDLTAENERLREALADINEQIGREMSMIETCDCPPETASELLVFLQGTARTALAGGVK